MENSIAGNSSVIIDFNPLTEFRLAESVIFSTLAGCVLAVSDWTEIKWHTALILVTGYYKIGGWLFKQELHFTILL